MAKRLADIRKEVESSGERFLYYLERNVDTEVFNFVTRLAKKTDIYIFSGVIRNFFLEVDKVRDLDIVISDDINLQVLFKDLSFSKNSFGGYKFRVGSISIDIWALEKTWALQYQKTLDFDNLEKYIPSTAFFNFSAIVFSLREGKFYCSKNFLSFLRDKEINYVYKPNSNYALCVVNTLYYSNEYNLGVADKLINFLKVLSRKNLDYNQAQLKHFGEVKYSTERISNWINSLKVREIQ